MGVVGSETELLAALTAALGEVRGAATRAEFAAAAARAIAERLGFARVGLWWSLSRGPGEGRGWQHGATVVLPPLKLHPDPELTALWHGRQERFCRRGGPTGAAGSGEELLHGPVVVEGLWGRDRLEGVLIVDNEPDGDPLGPAAAVLPLIADYLARALDGFRLASESAARLRRGLRDITQAADALLACDDVHQACRVAVELARERLGVERCSIWLDDPDADCLRGTWGTDLAGRTTDERDCVSGGEWLANIRRDIDDHFPYLTYHGDHWAVVDGELRVVGQGWIAVTPMAVHKRSLGCFCNDTAVTGADVDEVQQELIAALSRLLGGVIERLRAEAALAAGEQRYQAVVEDQTEFIDRFLPDGTLTFVNDAACRAIGRSREEALGQSWFDWLPPGERQRVVEALAALTPENPLVEIEHPYVYPNGRVRIQRWLNRALFDEAGRLVEYQAVGRDVTEAKAAEEALSASEERLRVALEGSRVGVVDLDLRRPNPTLYRYWADLLGYPTDEILPYPEMWLRHLHPDDRDRAIAEFDEVLAGDREEYESTYRLRAKDGDWRWLLARGRVMSRREDGSALRYIGLLVDITEQKRTEEQLRRAKEQAEAADRAKSAFLAHISHELLTPMNGVVGMTELALEGPLTDQQRHCLQVGLSSAGWLRQMLDDILEYSALAAGRPTLVTSAFDLRASLLRTLQTIAPRAYEKGLELLWTVAPDVPDLLYGDVRRLQQVVGNLVINAVKYTTDGQLTVRVERAGDEPGRLRITVEDTGPGIPEAVREAIFQPFVQAGGPGPGGIGLGLAIVKEIVDRLGGAVTCGPAESGGARFTVELALGVGDQPPRPAPAGGPPVRLWADRPPLAEFLATELRARGATVTVGGEPAPEEVLLVDVAAGGAPPEAARLAGRRCVVCLPPGLEADVPPGATRFVKPVELDQLLDVLTAQTRLEPPSPPSPAPAGVAVLVVEDNEASRDLAQLILERSGHRCRLVATAAEARAAAAEPWDVILLDLWLPDADGLDLCRELQAARPRPKLIALTAHGLATDRRRCLEAGFDGYLAKPFRPRELLDLIAEVVGRP